MLEPSSLLQLYRTAREELTGGFEGCAIDLLKPALNFESAIWGSGTLCTNGAVMPHLVHRYEQPEESVAAWTVLNAKDPVAATCMSTPGAPVIFHAPSLFAGKAATPMRAYAKRYGRQSYMVCGVREAVQPSLMNWVSLYRRNPDAHFSSAERAIFTLAMQHLQEAQQINRKLQLAAVASAASPSEVLAISDLRGHVHTPWRELRELMEAEWVMPFEGRLPDVLLSAIATPGSHGYDGRTLVVRGRSQGGLLFLRFVKRKADLSVLTVRERQIAHASARGLAAKEVARAMGLSPATVRVHLKHVYEKLSVHSQSRLSCILGVMDGVP